MLERLDTHRAAGRLAQAPVPQASVPQASVPQASVPQASVPQASVPQAATPQASIPQASIPQASIPRVLIPSLFALVFLCAPNGASAAIAARGGALAEQWCSGCHVVASDQKHGSSQAPTFESIARRKNFDAKSVAYFLLNPHPPMPNFSLTRSEAADLAAYIATQK